MSIMTEKEFFGLWQYGLARVAAIVPRIYLANPLANAEEHIQLFKEAYADGVGYVMGPELGLTGYSCGDLFRNETLRQNALQALKVILRETSKLNLMFSVGLPLVVDGALYNVAATCYRGKILGITPKTYPPEYGEFYELRYFARATELLRKTITILGQIVPIGNNLLFSVEDYPEFVLSVEICEDGWVPVPMSAFAALNGATIIANLSASNDTIGKADYREELFGSASGRLLAALIYNSAGFGESTNDVAWGGHAFIADRGTIITRSKMYQLQSQIIIGDVDLRTLINDRIRQSSFHQNAADNKRDFVNISVKGELGDFNQSVYKELRFKIDSHPFVPADPKKLAQRCHEVFLKQATSLARKLESLPLDMRKVFIGISGGLDSTLALLVACLAMDMLGLPRTNIIAVTMPGFGTSRRTKRNAIKLVQACGAVLEKIPVTGISQKMFNLIGYNPATDLTEDKLVLQNVQAWQRMQILLTICCKNRGIVLGTGDLSEAFQGWCTFLADHASHYHVNGGVAKTLIPHLIAWASANVFTKEPLVQRVLADIIDTPISPELLPTDKDGKIAQKTENKIGPYELIDFYMYYMIRFGFSPVRIARYALQAFEGKYSIGEIKNWFTKINLRFFYSQFKRNVSMEQPKIGLVALSPRGDWRMPSDAQVDAWTKDIESIPDQLN